MSFHRVDDKAATCLLVCLNLRCSLSLEYAVKSCLSILFVIPAFDRTGHALVDQPNKLLQSQMSLRNSSEQRKLGLSQEPHKLLLFRGEEDVFGQGGDQLLPDGHVPLGKSLQLSKD